MPSKYFNYLESGNATTNTRTHGFTCFPMEELPFFVSMSGGRGIRFQVRSLPLFLIAELVNSQLFLTLLEVLGQFAIDAESPGVSHLLKSRLI